MNGFVTDSVTVAPRPVAHKARRKTHPISADCAIGLHRNVYLKKIETSLA
jgi:hypothetical protein